MGWPTTDEPRDNFLTLRLTDAEQAEVDAYANRRGEKRTPAAREALLEHIRADNQSNQNSGGNSKKSQKKGGTP